MSVDSPKLTAKHAEAAQYVADAEKTHDEIAAQLGIDQRTLTRWKALPQFQARVSAIIATLQQNLERYSIARKDKRVAEYDRAWSLQQQIRAARAADPGMADVPGGTTGMIVRTYKQVGQGKGAHLVEEYAYDTGMDAAMRAMAKQAAQEAGQWTERQEHTGKDGGPIESQGRILFMLPPKDSPPDPGAPPGNE